jgi:hypothetical protein
MPVRRWETNIVSHFPVFMVAGRMDHPRRRRRSHWTASGIGRYNHSSAPNGGGEENPASELHLVRPLQQAYQFAPSRFHAGRRRGRRIGQNHSVVDSGLGEERDGLARESIGVQVQGERGRCRVGSRFSMLVIGPAAGYQWPASLECSGTSTRSEWRKVL